MEPAGRVASKVHLVSDVKFDAAFAPVDSGEQSRPDNGSSSLGKILLNDAATPSCEGRPKCEELAPSLCGRAEQ